MVRKVSELPPLWEHQKITIEAAKNKNSFALLHDAGVGKTRTMIEIYRQKCANNGRLLRTLILCPQVVLGNWRNEIIKYSKIEDKDIVILKGSGHDRYDLLMSNAAGEKRPKIFLCNFESLLMEKLYKGFQWYGFECIIADESHRIKSPTSKRTKALIALSREVKHKFILTGTPVLRSPLDLFSQFQFLDGGKTFAPVGNNYFAFRNHFFYNANANKPAHVTWPDFKIKPGAVEEISEKIKAISTHFKKSECLTLPPLVQKTIHVELSSEQKKHYSSMKKNFITFLEDKACTAQLAITKALRLQQIVCGFIQLEGSDEVVQLKENPRLDALEEILEDLVVEGGHKIIIWACWKANYAQIRDLLHKMKIPYTEAHGEVSAKAKQEAIDNFCGNENIKVILGNQGALGIGVNLVQAAYSIYYSRNFSLEQDIQSEARNYRGGSERHESVTRIDLVTPQSIDESILQALANKQEIGDKLLRDMARNL